MQSLSSVLRGSSIDEFTASCYLDFKFFCENALTYERLKIAKFHIDWFNYFMTKPRVCIVAPRCSGKTTILGVAFPIWVSLFYRKKQFLIISNSMKQSTLVLEQIVNNILDNEFLAKLKPSERNMSWTKTEINTSTGCKILCKPYSNNVRGEHVNYVLCDEASLYQDTQIFFGAIVSTVKAKKGHIMVIGTPQTHVDLIAQLSDKKLHPEYFSKVYPAIKDGKSLWPERYDKDSLSRLLKELGEATFAREYLCSLEEEGVSAIPFGIIVKGYDKSLSFEPHADGKAAYYTGVDFAMSPKGDYSVFITLKKEDETLTIVDIKRFRGLTFDAQENIIRDINMKFRPVKIVLDESTFGKPFVDKLIAEGLPVDGFYFTPDNRNTILKNLTRLFWNERIKIPRSGKHPEEISTTDQLSRELTEFVPDKTPSGNPTYKTLGKYDDCLMALALACYGATMRGQFLSLVKIVKRGEPPYAHETEKIFRQQDYKLPFEGSTKV